MTTSPGYGRRPRNHRCPQSGKAVRARTWRQNLKAIIRALTRPALGLLLAGLFAAPALADGTNQDCPFVGRVPNYNPANDNAGNVAIWHSYDSFTYRVTDGAGSKMVTKSGKHCKQQYWPAAGAQRMSDLEIMENFKEQLPQEGAHIVYSDDSLITATLSKDGSEYWIQVTGGSQGVSADVVQSEPFKSTILAASVSDFSHDCPFIGRIPNYLPANDNAGNLSDWRTYQSFDFFVTEGGSRMTVTQTGKHCHQQYWPPAGALRTSGLEIMENFRQQLPQEGAQIVYTSDSEITAKAAKDGTVYWIKVDGDEQGIQTNVVEVQPFKRTLLPPSDPDYRLLGHMPGYVAQKPYIANYDQTNFNVASGQTLNVRGYKYTVQYNVAPGANRTSVLEVQANYRAALKDIGANILRADDDDTIAQLDDHGKTVWIEVGGGEQAINLSVIEEKPFQSSIQPPKASEMKTALDKTGRIALYINFDFNKATLRPDAAPIIAQIVTLLKSNPGLNVSIEGNTDNIGGHDYNVNLSQARAASVVAAIVKSGIAAGRLKSAGFGPDKPVADNSTEDGRAKNRRVDLVKG